MMVFRHKTVLILVLTLCILSFSGCSRSVQEKERIFELVTEHQEVLQQDVERDAYDDSRAIEGIRDVCDVEQYVIYDCGGYGIAPSSAVFGFYHSPENVPLCVFDSCIISVNRGFQKDGDGYSGNFGGNSYYTEKICDTFWFFEFRF